MDITCKRAAGHRNSSGTASFFPGASLPREQKGFACMLAACTRGTQPVKDSSKDHATPLEASLPFLCQTDATTALQPFNLPVFPFLPVFSFENTKKLKLINYLNPLTVWNRWHFTLLAWLQRIILAVTKERPSPSIGWEPMKATAMHLSLKQLKISLHNDEINFWDHSSYTHITRPTFLRRHTE